MDRCAAIQGLIAISSTLRSIALVGVTSILFGCVGVNTVTLFKASMASGGESVASGDGVAYLAGSACLHVSDRGAEIRTIAARDYDAPKELIRIAVWIVPERSVGGITFVPSEAKLTYDDGAVVRPSSAQVSRIKTKWVKEKTLILAANENEEIDYVDHGAQLRGPSVADVVQLWDWTRVTFEFPRANERSSPTLLDVQGLQLEGAQLPTRLVRFEKIKESRAVFPGTSADGVSTWDQPYRTCRKLQLAADRTVPR